MDIVYRTSSFCSGGDCTAVGFRISSFCHTGGCVEVGMPDGDVHVRDTKAPTRPAIVFPAGEWAAFLDGVKAGEL